MTVTCVIQARMGSTRLPGKVLADLDGRPLLGFMLARLASLPAEHLVVATSTLTQDDPVADLARNAGVDVFRGSEADVLDRFAGAMRRWPSDVVVRLTADCPLMDARIVADALALRSWSGADYCSNSLVRTYPKGLDVEVLTAQALIEAADKAVDPVEREHVTPFVYRHPERFRLVALRTDELAGDEWWTVDTPADLDRVRSIAAAVNDPVDASWTDLLAAAGRLVRAAPERPLLRPAIAGDCGWMDELDGSPNDTVVIGPVDGRRPVGEHLGDGAVRTWVLDRGPDQLPAGWVQLEVVGGVGRLRGAVRRALEHTLLDQVRARLAQDLQVVRFDPSTTGDWAPLG